MKADDVKEFRRLTDENGWLKRMVADQTLNTEILKEIARENSEPAGGCSKKNTAEKPYDARNGVTITLSGLL